MQKFPRIYQENIVKKIKKDYKKACERFQNIFKEEKGKKNINIAINVTKIFQKLKNKSFLGTKKNIIKWDTLL